MFKKIILSFLTIVLLFQISSPLTSKASTIALEKGKLDIESPAIQKELEQGDKDIKQFRIELESKSKEDIKKESEEALSILKKENPEKYQEIMDNPSVQASGKMGTNGDILTTIDNGIWWFRWGHTAIVRKNSDFIVEAWKGDGVRNELNDFGERFDTSWKSYVKGASWDNYSNAQAHAYSKIGKPYFFPAPKWWTGSYYCSQLVWQSWSKQGFNLDANGGDIVLPIEVIYDSQTVEY